MLTKHLESIDSCAIPEAPASDLPVRTCPPRPQRTRETSERGIPARGKAQARPGSGLPRGVPPAPAPSLASDSRCRSWGCFALPSRKTTRLRRIAPHESRRSPALHRLRAPGHRMDFAEARGWRKPSPGRNGHERVGPGPPNRAQSRKKIGHKCPVDGVCRRLMVSGFVVPMTYPAMASAVASSVLLPITQRA